MTTSYQTSAAPVVADISEIPVAVRGKDINELLYDLLVTVSPHGHEDKIVSIIKEFVGKVSPETECKLDTCGNLHVKIGDNPKTMFSSHMDTVQKESLGDKTTLHLSPELFVSASTSKSVQNYVNSAGDIVTETQMKAEARAAGANYTHYTLLADDLGHTETKRRLYGSFSQFDGWSNTHLQYTVKTTVKPVSCVLGADDKLGVYTMCKLIEAGVEGFYVFHVGEECGGVGSNFLATSHPELFRGYDHCVAFDRKGYSDIITNQSGGRCCSDEFAAALAKQMNQYLPPQSPMKGDPTGSFTDSANYTKLIPECTNVAVGYFSQHTAREHFDLEWFERHFIPAILKVNWSELPVVREATAPSASRFPSYGGYGSYSSGYSRRHGSYSGPRSVVSARRTKPTSDERKRQSNLDKAHDVLSNVESYDPNAGFYDDETSIQRRDRVLYTFTKDEMSLQDIAEMVVDADYCGYQRGEYDCLPSGQNWRKDEFWDF